jgi:predicted AAA+ superfamily ATPase
VIARSAAIDESYLIEPLSNQRFIVVRGPSELGKSVFVELVEENFNKKWTKKLNINERVT